LQLQIVFVVDRELSGLTEELLDVDPGAASVDGELVVLS
jgi:hypothetical protein